MYRERKGAGVLAKMKVSEKTEKMSSHDVNSGGKRQSSAIWILSGVPSSQLKSARFGTLRIWVNTRGDYEVPLNS
jgi:hypothetical protein